MIYEKIEILDAGAEGMAVGKAGEKVIFVPFVVPGDVVDIQVTRKKRRYLEGKAIRFHKYSDKRTEPHCSHFGLCGGCRWQSMLYEEQLYYKQKQVFESLTRIGKVENPEILDIHPSPVTRYYRNKLDFTFSNHRWLTEEDRLQEDDRKGVNALGFHVPQFFDKVVNIRECFHMRDPANSIRDTARDYADRNHLEYYDVRTGQGFLRNLILRNTEAGGWMVILVVKSAADALFPMLEYLADSFTEITSLYYVINPKQNDSLYDLDFKLYRGDPYIVEKMAPFVSGGKEIEYRIGPSSFFQTNSRQAALLYRRTCDFAGFTGDEIVYDLYSGTGTIACYVANYVKKVVGIESVAAAVADAEINARINGIGNCVFFAGEAEKLLTPGFFEGQGRPDIVVTDPPRNGMHEKVIRAMREAAPDKIIYVSCNPATQARDIALLKDMYNLHQSQPVDMFPHTQHVENIALLIRKKE